MATTERRELSPGSWVELTGGFIIEPHRLLSEVQLGASWQQTEVLRYDRYVPERRLTAAVRPDQYAALRQTNLHLQSRFRCRLDGVAAIWYRDGADFQGMHSDREMTWLDDTLIAIVVVGVRRPFVLRPRGSVPIERVRGGEHRDDIVLMPGEGDLLVMGGACQRDWLHGVPEAVGVDESRISLTWRWSSRTGRPDTNPTFYDGRSFSDDHRRRGSRRRPV